MGIDSFVVMAIDRLMVAQTPTLSKRFNAIRKCKNFVVVVLVDVVVVAAITETVS